MSLFVLCAVAFLFGRFNQESMAAYQLSTITPSVMDFLSSHPSQLTSTPVSQKNTSLTPSLISTPSPSPTMVISMGDLHIHTTCSDGSSTYDLIVKRAMKLRYAFIAITDHHYADTTICRQVIESCRNEKRILCIPGMEISGRVHLLGLGITKSVDKGLPVKEQVQAIHKQGGLAIAAHPYAIPRYSEEELFRSGLDATECNAVPVDERPHFLEMQQKYPIRCVFNSDAHNIFQMQTFNICQGKIKSLGDLKKALLENHCW
jgi:hypothetical protein